MRKMASILVKPRNARNSEVLFPFRVFCLFRGIFQSGSGYAWSSFPHLWLEFDLVLTSGLSWGLFLPQKSAVSGLLFSKKRAVFARLSDSLSLPRHGESSGELGSVTI
jgi:hypothetical protein